MRYGHPCYNARDAKVKRFVLLTVSLLTLGLPAAAKDLTVAVAANFTEPAKAIAAEFEKTTGHHVVMSFGPSGAFFSQIENGAPFEVFLSADAERPAKLEADGYGVKGTRFVYACGGLALWSARPGVAVMNGAVLTAGTFDHLAIADPASAPYGVAAVETMKTLGVYDAVAPKIVRGTSIAQAFTFTDSGSAEIGFVALSQVYRQTRGSIWIVPAADYSPIDQQAILLTPGEKDPVARSYLAFLKSPPAVAIIKSYGYSVR